MKKTFIPVLFLGILLSGCSNEEKESFNNEPISPVSFSPTIKGILQERAVKDSWTSGDKIAIFSDIAIKKDGSTTTTAINYTRDQSLWSSPSEDERWYFANATDTHNFYAYYPIGNGTNVEAIELPDISGQDGTESLDELKESKEFMRGTGNSIKKDENISLTMSRVFAFVNLKVKLKENAFAGNAATLKEVSFTGTSALVNSESSSLATVNLKDGAVACSNITKIVNLAPAAGFTLTNSAEISIPLIILPQNGKISVQFTIGDKTSDPIELSAAKYDSGYIYSYSVEIDAALKEIGIGDPNITEWKEAPGSAITPVIPN